MSSKDDEDLTRVLDGWVPGGAQTDPPLDPTRVLDGWSPGAARSGAAPRPELPAVEELQPRRPNADPDPERSRLPPDLNLNVSARFSKRDSGEVTDVDAVWKPREFVRRNRQDEAEDADWTPGAISTSVRKPPLPRVLDAWKPGAWIGAARGVFDAVAHMVNTAQGPVVETYPSHVLLALWPPQSMSEPFLGRWPQRVWLAAVPLDDAGAELLKHLPPQAEVWVGEHDIDWALAGEAVLLHEPGLRDFQLKELRAFVEAEKLANWERLNKAYRRPAAGLPIERA